jgi:hypothetical protein
VIRNFSFDTRTNGFVIPAKAGIPFFLKARRCDQNWIPAFAGMTRFVGAVLLMAVAYSFVLPPAEAETVLPAGRTASIDVVLADARSRGIDHLPFAQLLQAVAQLPELMGKPYVAGTLDGSPDAESLYISLDGFDCVTYVETVVALSRTLARQGDTTLFAGELAALRYRHGQPTYCERLHYFTDWIRNNTARGILDDVTIPVAGDASKLAFHALPSGVDFMSRHAAKLHALAASASHQKCIAAAEAALTQALPRDAAGTSGVTYIDTAHLAQVVERLHGGDLLALVAETSGLDVIHVGIVLDGVDGGPLRFAHASSARGEVSVAGDLQAWLATSPRARGAIVIRPLAPAN